MGTHGLSRYPLLTFLLACVCICFIIVMHRKKFKIKSFIALFYLGTIISLGITIQRLNYKYFTLPKIIEILVDIAIFTSFAIMVILIFYIALKYRKRPPGSLPKFDKF